MLLAAAMFCLPVHGDDAGELTLEALMQTLARVEARSARFVERKHVALLREPIVYRGTLSYEAPDYLAKRFDSGEVESYEVRGDRLRIRSPDGTWRDVALETQPLLSAFIDAFRATLAGDRARLEASYRAEVDGSAKDWHLTLVPRLPALAEHLESVIIEGTGAIIHTVEVREANGDSSVMTLERADA
ncbi:MAG: LolA-related protein [Gammaproteobacteria bacterium]|nr:LolA-related protein [Gammaproteobacteria bacterium]